MNRVKTVFCFFLFIISFLYVKDLEKNIDVFSVLLNNKKVSIVEQVVSKRLKIVETFKDKTMFLKKESGSEQIQTNTIIKEPIIYIFNTHQTEEYAKSAYNITPTVVTVSNILSDELQELGIPSLVETRDVTKEVHKRGYDYSGTYTVSLENLKFRKSKHKSLEYFFDMHRDSIVGEDARVTINGKKYATMMFLIGANHKDYGKNLKNVKIMEKYLKNNYPGLVRETYIQKMWAYNQWYSPKMFLVELGGPDNTLEEVYNTSCALSKAIKYYVELEQ